MLFSEQKATEIAAYLLKLRGSPMSYLKLIKLIYLADREALNRWGFSITNDNYVSMPHGPVVSKIKNLITEEIEKPYWAKYISAPSNYEVQLIRDDCPVDKLSRAEEKLLNEIFEQYGAMSRWDLVDLTHKLPEWHDPKGSSLPISVQDILAAQGVPKQEIASILHSIEESKLEECVLGDAH